MEEMAAAGGNEGKKNADIFDLFGIRDRSFGINGEPTALALTFAGP